MTTLLAKFNSSRFFPLELTSINKHQLLQVLKNNIQQKIRVLETETLKAVMKHNLERIWLYQAENRELSRDIIYN